MGVAYTIDGGATWHESLFQGAGDNELTPLINGPGYKGGDPSVAFDSSGDPYACLISFGGTTSGVYVAKSFDGGMTFTQITTVRETATSLSEDKPYVAIDTVSMGPYRDNIYVSWTNLSGLGMVFSRSTDGGLTFSAPMQWPGVGGIGAVPVVGSDGAVYVCYAGGSNMYVGKSVDGGASFLPEKIVSSVTSPSYWPDGTGEFRCPTLPSIAVDNSGSAYDGTVYVVWQDARYGGDSDILLSRSTDGGQTWSAPTMINDNDESVNETDQFFAWVAVDDLGRVAVFFNDRRNDPNNWLCDVYAAISLDGGQTFLPNIRVSDQSFDPHLNGFSGTGDNGDVKAFRFFGDYLGIAAAGDSFYAAWADTRDGGSLDWGDSNIYASRILDAYSDADEDGLPDFWELSHFGDLSHSAEGDDDTGGGDGETNYEEYVAGTDPTDPLSVFRMTEITRFVGPEPSVTIFWNSVDDRTYSVHYSDSSFGGSMLWSVAEDAIPSSGTGTNTWLDSGDWRTGNVSPDDVPHRYYRVSVDQPTM
jgi:hypothetical protein